jgi:hypothetical protein
MKITKLNSDKPLVRETALESRGVALVVALHPRFLEIRPKGTQEWFPVDYEAIYHLAMKLDARQREARAVGQ